METDLRFIHPAVDDWVVHGVAHGNPENDEVHVLDVELGVDL